ncbi:disintegrin and metalloproteinase domain-containing protein 9-like [Rhinatrema bivittatum]|uniref:disintegrin and metalloproteinase domain-containing protein 9-like n=1 Tax=Rhinatrema bivittatum TaxID=194408 RepID=UPI0011261BBE|nr:disintegrin and metalloproteinase domain-containing protein 9-like [Rhinatrema bivittatum]
MDHDTESCACDADACIMKGTLSITSTFSQCSINYYTELIKQGRADCLLNIPADTSIFHLQLCGNKVLDGDEPCDCGSEKECQNDPCCEFNCKLRKGTECVTGTCCYQCKFIKKGKPCRLPISECDLAEYCSGASETCPPDTYAQNGTPCNNGQSICYNNNCYDPDRHCRTMFGKGAKMAALECFIALNTIGDRFGNCGSQLGKTWKKCETVNVKCGRAKCEKVREIHTLDTHTAIIQFSSGEDACWGMDYHYHMDMEDHGDIPEGARCDERKICIDRKCVPESNISYDCDIAKKCSGRGVCNTNKNCHCNMGWAPPDCAKPGYGGSSDSGPLIKGSFISYVLPPEEDDDDDEKEEELHKELTNPWKVLMQLSIALAIIVPIISTSIIIYMTRNAIRDYFSGPIEMKTEGAEGEGKATRGTSLTQVQ